MIAKKYQIVPFDPLPAAVAHAIQVVIERKGNNSKNLMARHVYAKAFFRALTGSSVITSKEIRRLIPTYQPRSMHSMNKQSILDALELCLITKGEFFPLPLPLDLRGKLFPCYIHRKSQRETHHHELNRWRERRITEKNHNEKKNIEQHNIGLAWLDLDGRNKKQLKHWYNKWGDSDCGEPALNSSAIESLLQRWYEKNVVCEWGFNNLYYGMSPSAIIYDLALS
jgi:hypothetical protein